MYSKAEEISITQKNTLSKGSVSSKLKNTGIYNIKTIYNITVHNFSFLS